jgi:hypothetical protein
MIVSLIRICVTEAFRLKEAEPAARIETGITMMRKGQAIAQQFFHNDSPQNYSIIICPSKCFLICNRSSADTWVRERSSITMP